MKAQKLIYTALLSIVCGACNPNYDMMGMFNGTSPEIAERFADSRRFSEKAGVVHMQMPSDYRFTGANYETGKKLDLYICLDTAEGTLGTDQLKWLKALLAEKKNAGYRHIIVFTHTHLFKQDSSQGHTSNLSMEETYELTYLLSDAGVELYLCGHDHSREVTSYGGVKYITVDSSTDAEPEPYYMVMEVGKQITYDFISLLPIK